MKLTQRLLFQASQVGKVNTRWWKKVIICQNVNIENISFNIRTIKHFIWITFIMIIKSQKFVNFKISNQRRGTRCRVVGDLLQNL